MVVSVDVCPHDPGGLVLADLVVLVPLGLAQRCLLLRGVDELNVSFAVVGLVVVEHPYIRGDARAEENLGRQLHDAIDQVLAEKPATDAGRSAPRVAVEQRRAGEHDGRLAPAFSDRCHFRGDVLHEQHAAVVYVWLAGAEPAPEPVLHLVEDPGLLLPPFFSIGWVGQLVMERAVGELVVVERVAAHDAGGQVGHLVEHIARTAGDVSQHERRLSHGPGRVLQLLAVWNYLGGALEMPLFVPLVELVERVADEAAGAAAAVVQRADGSVVSIEQGVLVGEQQGRGKARHVLGRHEVLGVLRDLLAVLLDQVLVDVGHHAVGDGVGPEVEVGEPGAHLVEHALLVELLAGLPHLKALQDLACVGGEPVDVGHERVARLGRA